MWKYCILIYEHNDYVLQVDAGGVKIGSDMSIARFFTTVEELHSYAKNGCNLGLDEYGVVGYYDAE